MERLIDPKLLPASALVGAGTAAACLPYVAAQRAELEVPLVAAFAVLAVACGVIWQAHQAWNPPEPSMASEAWWRRRVGGLNAWQTGVVGLILLAIHVMLGIPFMVTHAPELLPPDHRSVWLGLPFIALFQALLLVGLPYVFAFRVTAHRSATMLLVVLITACGSTYAFRDYDAQTLLALLALRLPRYVFLLLIYRRWRFIGLALVTTLFWLTYLTL